ncbi:oligosaccharide flippase family protein [Paucibacter sp. R3-3]|uniref:Oligosaccharide flippase family protein n=1 Tax=Roseateles agri TaxID=3098619 RepID=A0ABU5DCJ8_9BURK|nr:oligosaccharide flippase family protein [Paucibacter sp. R3-3]MDY0743859.1 oligosaccharide flippase family protein [Paucibacter sp. R3-3]
MTLTSKVFAAIKSNYLGTLVRVGAQLVAQVFIMRELGPDLVGAFGYVSLLNGVLALVVDQGFGWSLIQSSFAEQEVAIAYSRMMLAGLLCGVGVFICSFPLEIWLANPLVGQVVRYSAPAYLLIGPYAASHARLRRDLRFRELQYATTGAYVIAYPGVGLVLAWCGFGVWSLLGAWYTQALLQILIGQYYVKYSLRLVNPFATCAAGALGRQVAGINVLNWAVDNASGVVVGGMGAGALGNFNAASVLARQPALQLVQTLQVLLFSTASALERDEAKIRRLYLTALSMIGFAVAPLYAYVWAHADFLVSFVFGHKWLAAGAVLAALSPGMVAMALSTVTSSVLTATGHQREVVRSQALCLALMLVGLFVAHSHTVNAIGWAVSVAYLARCAQQLLVVVRVGAISRADMWASLRGPALLAVAAALPLSTWFRLPGSNLQQELVSVVLTLILVFVLVVLFPRWVVSPASAELLERSATGRRLLARLRLVHPSQHGNL